LTAYQAHIKALTFIDRIKSDGTVDANVNNLFLAQAPLMISNAQSKVAAITGLKLYNDTITTIGDATTSVELEVDGQALEALVYDVAAQYAYKDERLDLSAMLTGRSNEAMNLVKPQERHIKDLYNSTANVKWSV